MKIIAHVWHTELIGNQCYEKYFVLWDNDNLRFEGENGLFRADLLSLGEIAYRLRI